MYTTITSQKNNNDFNFHHFFLINLFYLFIYFWLRWVLVAARGLPPVAASRGHSSKQRAGFSLRWPLLLWSTGSRHAGLSSCGMRAQQPWLAGCRAQAQYLWHTSPVDPRHVGSSGTRARTHVPRIGRQTPSHRTTREVPTFTIYWPFFPPFRIQSGVMPCI